MGQLHPVRQPSSIVTLTTSYQEILSILSSPVGKVTKLDELKIELMNVGLNVEEAIGEYVTLTLELRWNDGTSDHIISRHSWTAYVSSGSAGKAVTASGGTIPSEFLTISASKLQILAADFYVGLQQYVHSEDDIGDDDGLGASTPPYKSISPSFPIILGDSESIKLYAKVVATNSVLRMRRQFIANAVKDIA